MDNLSTMSRAEDGLPGYDELLAMVKDGTYDVPALAEKLGLTQSHVRLLLSTIAEDDAVGPYGTIENMIEVQEVGVVANSVTLLAPVSVATPSGRALIVRGRNGTGKSTLLRVLAGVRQPSSGMVRIAGEAVAQRDKSFRRRVAAMIGLPPMAPDLTVFDHTALVATTWLDDPIAAEGVARDVLEELGLGELVERFPHELSSGQTQLFGLALVLARPFEVLILDEPEQRLDPEHVESVVHVLRGRRDAGATLVIATHSAVLADGLADQTLSLDAAA